MLQQVKDYKISLIAAMAKNNIIGQDNQMPWHLPDDLKFFKKNTQGKTMIMGRKTFQSIGSTPLAGRRNIVISRDLSFNVNGAQLFTSIDKAILSCDKNEEIMIIGGGQLYKSMLPYASKLYLTRVDVEITGDTSFPKYSVNDWQEAYSEFHPADEKHKYSFYFKLYKLAG
jgi:dihydrofolate reductase